MKIHLLSNTHLPLHTIAAATLSIGTGKGVKALWELPEEEAVAAFRDTCRTKLDSPLEFASFVFFWEDVPIFLLRELIRHRVGCSYAEQSLRFAVLDSELVTHFPSDYVPSADTPQKQAEIRRIFYDQMAAYQRLLNQGISVQDARNVLGVWVPTHITTGFTYRALREILSLRQTSQAHPAWQDAVRQIKELVHSVHPVLAEELRDVCYIQGRCVWLSKMDRPCSACAARGLDPNHTHNYVKHNDGWAYCTCGERQRWQVNIPTVFVEHK